MKWRQGLQEILHLYDILTIYGIQVTGQKKFPKPKLFISVAKKIFPQKFAYSNILYLFQVLITKITKEVKMWP